MKEYPIGLLPQDAVFFIVDKQVRVRIPLVIVESVEGVGLTLPQAIRNAELIRDRLEQTAKEVLAQLVGIERNKDMYH